jgi:hypothetical protein
MSQPPITPAEAPTCQAKKSDGTPCKRKVAQGQKVCYQHAIGLRAKLRAFTRNETILFVCTVLGVPLGIVAIVITFLAWVRPEFWSQPTPTAGASQPLIRTQPPSTAPTPSKEQTPPVRPTRSRLRANRDMALPEDTIRSISVEARLTCDLKSGVEIPPAEVETLMGFGVAHLRGAGGDAAMTLVSPVRFRREGGNQVVVIDEYSLQPSSVLDGRPIASLRNFDTLVLPITTVVYGKALDRLRLVEASVRINGKDVWYYSWKLDAAFQEGPVFSIPLAGLHDRLTPPPPI